MNASGLARKTMIVLYLCVCGVHSTFAADNDAAKLFGTPPAFVSGSLSPNGKSLAFVTPIDGIDNVVVLPLDSTGKPFRFSASDGRMVGVTWHDDTRLIARLRVPVISPYDRRFDLNYYRYSALSPTDAKPAVLFANYGLNLAGPATSIIDISSSDPLHIYMSAFAWHLHGGPDVRPSPYDFGNDLVRVNLHTGASELVRLGGPDTVKWIMDGDGNLVARVDVSASHQDTIYIPSGKEFQKLTTINDTDGRIVGLTEDGRSLAVIARRERGRFGLYRLDLASGMITDQLFLNPKADVVSVLLDERTSRVIGVTYYDGDIRAFYFAPERQRLQKQIEDVLPGQTIAIISTTLDKSKSLVYVSAPRSPPSLQLVNLQTSRIDTIAEAYPQLRGVRLGNVRHYVYSTPDGLTLTGLLTLPPGKESRNLPVLVLPAGGFGYSDGSFDWFAQYFAYRGYAVFQAGTRDLTSLGDVFGMDELGAWMKASQEDIASGLDDLIAKGIADPKRVCIAGSRESGYLALSATVFVPDHYACAISFSGLSDIKISLENARDASQLALNDFNSNFVRNSKDFSGADLERFSPARRADMVRVPILVIVGDRDDSRVQGETMRDALESAKKQVDFVSLKDESGLLYRPESRFTLLNEVDRFLTQQIGH